MSYVYILYSDRLGKFYVGSSELIPEDRLELHLKRVYGEKQFTARAEDWKLFSLSNVIQLNKQGRLSYISKG